MIFITRRKLEQLIADSVKVALERERNLELVTPTYSSGHGDVPFVRHPEDAIYPRLESVVSTTNNELLSKIVEALHGLGVRLHTIRASKALWELKVDK
jgi:hypothetical protein